MNLLNPPRQLEQTSRRRRSAGLLVESIEGRLMPSPTLPLPPPHVPSLVAPGLSQGLPRTPGGSGIVADFLTPDPC
jgi:hypothetical protein